MELSLQIQHLMVVLPRLLRPVATSVWPFAEGLVEHLQILARSSRPAQQICRITGWGGKCTFRPRPDETACIACLRTRIAGAVVWHAAPGGQIAWETGARNASHPLPACALVAVGKSPLHFYSNTLRSRSSFFNKLPVVHLSGDSFSQLHSFNNTQPNRQDENLLRPCCSRSHCSSCSDHLHHHCLQLWYLHHHRCGHLDLLPSLRRGQGHRRCLHHVSDGLLARMVFWECN